MSQQQAQPSVAEILASTQAAGAAASKAIAQRLKGKVAIVTGAGTGIGAATAVRFAQEGAHVVLVGRRAERLNEVIAQIKALKTGTEAVSFVGDVGEEETHKKLIEFTLAKFGALHIAFNNAGIYRGQKPIWETDFATYREVIKTNVDSIFLGLKYQIPVIAKAGGGSIINNSSTLGLRAGFPGSSSYDASKFAVTGFTQASALDAAPLKVRINSVNPGITQTEIAGTGDQADAFNATFGSIAPLKRPGHSNEIAAAVAFLASDEASFITGSSLLIDGGVFLK